MYLFKPCMSSIIYKKARKLRGKHHQYKQWAEKCLLFLLFPSLLAVSNVRFSKIVVLGIFTNLTH